MNGVISVIMPVYNVAGYLPQCLDSVLSQDYDQLEVILVDDGSKDDSGAICDAYAARDSRVKVIHQKNGGAAAAKNAGLRIATGEYLSFVDSDDWLEPDVFGYMVDILWSEQADMVQCAFRDAWRNRTEDRVFYTGRTVTDSDEYLRRLLRDYSCVLLWNKLYRREIFDGIFFEEGHKIDDEYFIYLGFLKDRKVVFDDRIIYNYRQRASSVMNSPAAAHQRLLDKLDVLQKRRKVVLAQRPQLKKDYDGMYLDSLWCLSRDPGNTEETLQQIRQLLRQYILTFGNTFPPRYLWGLLWDLWRSSPAQLLEQCRKTVNRQNTDEFYA